ncbi:MAG: hypothetical protein EBU90_03080 [Proteobacteria bacterium]|nr:hypothetical protein [Pseudomonadota bacterium]NBP13309.1 hypothetical protein [bacterium]
MEFVRPVQITSPISGQPVAPKIVERVYGGKLYKECHWIDPASGTFIRKGLLSVEDLPSEKKD